jgi:hypothetical protein
LTPSFRAEGSAGAVADPAVAAHDTPIKPIDREPNFCAAANLAASSDAARMIVFSTPASFIVTAHW